ncbi:MAG: hypothetical protein N2Z79_02580 [Candidatus Omnitrophica bacterium]|nr:hypothetical protein [Candidatus Omnitrophota bacterium]
MKKSYFILFFFFSLLFSASPQNWQEKRGEHFIVYFTSSSKEDFLKEVLDKAERYYQEIALALGYPRYKEFWLWDKRVKIYIYPDRESFLKATGQPSWSHGVAEYNTKKISSFLGSKDFLESVLPHEIAHLIFRDFVGFKGQIPLWLDEGVAQWSEKKKREETRKLIKSLYEQDILLTIDDLMYFDVRTLPEKEGVIVRPTYTKEGKKGVVFLSKDNFITTYYLQSVSLVDFLISKYGTNRFTDFCRNLRDGKNIEDALRNTYSGYIHNLKDLEARWRKYLEETSP